MIVRLLLFLLFVLFFLLIVHMLYVCRDCVATILLLDVFFLKIFMCLYKFCS